MRPCLPRVPRAHALCALVVLSMLWTTKHGFAEATASRPVSLPAKETDDAASFLPHARTLNPVPRAAASVLRNRSARFVTACDRFGFRDTKWGILERAGSVSTKPGRLTERGPLADGRCRARRRIPRASSRSGTARGQYAGRLLHRRPQAAWWASRSMLVGRWDPQRLVRPRDPSRARAPPAARSFSLSFDRIRRRLHRRLAFGVAASCAGRCRSVPRAQQSGTPDPGRASSRSVRRAD